MFNEFIQQNYDIYKEFKKLNKKVFEITSNDECTSLVFVKIEDRDIVYLAYENDENEENEFDTCSISFLKNDFNFKEAYQSIAEEIVGEQNFEDIDFDGIEGSTEGNILEEIKEFLDEVEKQYLKFELKETLQNNLSQKTNKSKRIKI